MTILGRLVLAALVIAGALALSQALVASETLHDGDRLVELCASALVVELWLLVLAGVGALFVARPEHDALGLAPGRLSWRALGWLALGTLAASHALDGVLDLTGLSERSVLGRVTEILEGARGPRLLLAFFALAVMPGIAEELLCRGLVQRGLMRRFGPLLAIPGAALLFGALHVEPIHAAFASVLGLYLGVVAWRGDSSRPAILCHGANNLAAVGLAAWLGGDVPWPPLASVLGGGAVAAVCLWAGRSSPELPGPLQPGPRPSD